MLIQLQARAEEIVFPSLLNSASSFPNGNKKPLSAEPDKKGLSKAQPKRKRRKNKPGTKPAGVNKPRAPIFPLNIRKRAPRKYKLEDTRSAIELQFIALGTETEMIVPNPKEHTILIQINTDHPGGENLADARTEAVLVALFFACGWCEENGITGKYPFYKPMAKESFANLVRNFAFLMTDHKG